MGPIQYLSIILYIKDIANTKFVIEGEYMKVIFLDIDGVLNSKGTASLDNTYIDRLRQLVKETDAKIVLSSSWKDIIYNPDDYNESDKSMLDRLMNKEGLPFIGVLPDINEDKREAEITEWLNDHKGRVESFVILDDLPYRFIEVFPMNFVRTGGYLFGGLSDKNVEDAIEILNRTNKE